MAGLGDTHRIVICPSTVPLFAWIDVSRCPNEETRNVSEELMCLADAAGYDDRCEELFRTAARFSN